MVFTTLFAVTLAAGVPATNDAVAATAPDARYEAFLGCWGIETDRIPGRAATSRLCVLPREGGGVRLLTVSEGMVVSDEALIPDDVVRPTTTPGCRGTERAVWATTFTGIFRSADAGETWTQLTDSSFRIGYPDQLVYAPDDAQRMFVAGGFATPNFWVEQKTAKGTVMISEDGGQTWRAPASGFPESRANVEALTLCAFPGGYEIFAGTTEGEVFVSADKGESWQRIASGLPAIGKPTHDTLIVGMGYGSPEEALSA